MSEAQGLNRREEIIRALRETAPVPGASHDLVRAAALRVLVIADEPIFREGLLRLLGQMPDVDVVGWADRVTTAALMVNSADAEAVIVSVHPPDQAHDMAVAAPELPVVMLTAAPTLADITAATAAGIRGVLARASEVEVIVAAVRAVRRGLVVHPVLDRGVIATSPTPTTDLLVTVAAADPVDVDMAQDQLPDRVPERPGAAGELALLTAREQEILQLLVDGYAVKQVASRLGIAMQTAKNHIHNIMMKIGASSRLQLCAWANNQGVQPNRPLLRSTPAGNDFQV